LKWFVADVLAMSSRHEGRRTKMLVGHSLSCCTKGNSVDLEWLSADYERLFCSEKKPIAAVKNGDSFKSNQIKFIEQQRARGASYRLLKH